MTVSTPMLPSLTSVIKDFVSDTGRDQYELGRRRHTNFAVDWLVISLNTSTHLALSPQL